MSARESRLCCAALSPGSSAQYKEGTLIKALLFRIGSEEYAVDASQVHSVLRLPPAWASAPTSAGADGVAEVNGTAITVFVPWELLDDHPETVTSHTRLIVMSSATGPKGFVANAVNSVATIDDFDVKPLPAVIAGQTEQWLQGVITLEDRVLLILDLCQYVASRELQLDHGVEVMP